MCPFVRPKHRVRLLALPFVVASVVAVAQQTGPVSGQSNPDVPLSLEWRNGPVGAPPVTDDRSIAIAGGTPADNGSSVPCSFGRASAMLLATLACGYSGRCVQTGSVACESADRSYRNQR